MDQACCPQWPGSRDAVWMCLWAGVRLRGPTSRTGRPHACPPGGPLARAGDVLLGKQPDCCSLRAPWTGPPHPGHLVLMPVILGSLGTLHGSPPQAGPRFRAGLASRRLYDGHSFLPGPGSVLVFSRLTDREPILQMCVLISRGCKPFCKLSPAQEERAAMWRGRRRSFSSRLLRVALCRLDLIPR